MFVSLPFVNAISIFDALIESKPNQDKYSIRKALLIESFQLSVNAFKDIKRTKKPREDIACTAQQMALLILKPVRTRFVPADRKPNGIVKARYSYRAVSFWSIIV